jgi:hypothetical protein
MRECTMCEQCVESDGKIEHYKNLSSLVTDQRTLDGIKKLIARLEAEKKALHPEGTAVCSDLNNRNRDFTPSNLLRSRS